MSRPKEEEEKMASENMIRSIVAVAVVVVRAIYSVLFE